MNFVMKFFFLLIIVMVFSTCSNPTNPGISDDPSSEDTPTDSPTETPTDPSSSSSVSPENVTAKFKDGEIQIVWNEVIDATEYQIYRKDGLFDYELISTSSTVAFSDASYPKNLSVQYAVKSVVGGFPSPLSDPTESLTEWIRNLEVSRLEYTNKIALSWEKQIEAEEYVVYRASSRGGTPEEIARFASTDPVVEYSDMSGAVPPEADKPYYYQIRWIKTGTEYGASSPVHLGLFSSSVDIGEPSNEDMDNLTGGTFVQSPGTPPILYSFGDNAGGIDADTDWYKYEGKAGQSVSVTITKDEGLESKFGHKELQMQFSYNDQLSGIRFLNEVTNTQVYDIPDPGLTQEDVTLYFKIYPVVPDSKTIIESYSVAISNSL